ncbi:hypothetical protein [Actinoplanes sp. NPDC051851]|uniref:WXG100 family type VII secretion target n=1 Tax=Actinoplanes sp. NPDC051851 TaxID=3154753 RepID=UPI00342D4194
MTRPLVAPAHDSTTAVTGFGLIEDAQQISEGIRDRSWVEGTLGGAGTALDTLSLVVDPIGTLAAWGVAWLMEHVQPLQDILDRLAGNADEVAAHAATWANVAALTGSAREEYAARLRTEAAGWFGAAGDAYRTHAGEHLAVLDGITTAANGISYAIEGAGLLVAAVRGIVRDLIAEFLATLAVRLPQWLAEEGLTLGAATPLVISQVASLVARWADRIQHFVRSLLTSLRRLSPRITALGDILDHLRLHSDRLARSDPHRPTVPEPAFFSKSPVISNREVLDRGPGTPMTPENITATAERMGIDLGDIEVVIISEAEEIRYLDFMEACAYTPSELNGTQIRLGPASFADAETLAATIAHEHIHTRQQQNGEHLRRPLKELEDEAYAGEPSALDRYRSGHS